jgi:hypothetical protein
MFSILLKAYFIGRSHKNVKFFADFVEKILGKLFPCGQVAIYNTENMNFVPHSGALGNHIKFGARMR